MPRTAQYAGTIGAADATNGRLESMMMPGRWMLESGDRAELKCTTRIWQESEVLQIVIDCCKIRRRRVDVDIRLRWMRLFAVLCVAPNRRINRVQKRTPETQLRARKQTASETSIKAHEN